MNEQPYSIDLGQGLDQKSDAKQVKPESMTILNNRVFTKSKQLKKDFGYDRLVNDIQGGSTISTARMVTTFDDQLLLVGGSKCYAYSETEAKWIDSGDVTPVELTSETFVQGSFSASNVDSALVANYRVYSWTDSRGGVKASVYDNVSGSCLLSETSVSSTGNRQKCINLSATQVGIFYIEGANLKVRLFNSASPTSIGSAANVVTDVYNTVAASDPVYAGYDIHAASNATVLSYTNSGGNQGFSLLNSSGVVTTSGSATTTTIWQRVVVVVDTTGDSVFISGYGRNLQGYAFIRKRTDLTNVFSETTLDSPAQNGYISASDTITWLGFITKQTMTTLGAKSALSYIFPATNLAPRHAGKVFTYNSEYYIPYFAGDTPQETLFVVRVSDGLVVARALAGLSFAPKETSAALLQPTPQVSTESAGIFSFATPVKTRAISSDTTTNYQYGVNKVRLDFTEANPKQAVQANGNTIFSGAVTSAYDGVSVTELGFHLYPNVLSALSVGSPFTNPYFLITVTQQGAGGTPEIFTALMNIPGDFIKGGTYFTFTGNLTNYYVYFEVDDVGTDPGVGGATGIHVEILSSYTPTEVCDAVYNALNLASVSGTTLSRASNTITFTQTANGARTDATDVSVAVSRISAGAYQYRAMFEWTDSKGQIHRSSPSVAYSLTANAAQLVNITVPKLQMTEKKSPRSEIIVKIYRTELAGSVFYQVSSNVISSARPLNTDSYLNFYDMLGDTEITAREILYTNGGILENISPPASSAIQIAKNRIFLLDSENDRVWYSKDLQEGEGAAFNDALTSKVDSKGDSLTAIAEMDDKVLLFKQNEPYYINGDGPNDAGTGNVFSIPEPIISPVGASEKNSTVKSPIGIIFKARKGLYLMGRDLSAAYIGAPVEDYNSSTVLSADLVKDYAQIRLTLSSSVILIFDYDFNQWSVRSLSSTPVDACIWKNKHVYADSSGRVWTQSTSLFQDNSTNVVTSLETGWLKLGSIQGFGRVKRLMILGEYKSAHTLTVQAGYDYSTSYTDTYTITPSTSAVLQEEIHLKTQKCEAVRFKITEGAVAGTLLEGNTLTNLQLILGVKKGLHKLVASKKH